MKALIITIVILFTATANAVTPTKVNLWAHEGASKGHTIRKHVGKTRAYLLSRMKPKGTRFIGIAPLIRSTFTNQKEAEKFVTMAMHSNTSKIAKWINGNEARLAFNQSFGHSGIGSIGTVAYRKTLVSFKGVSPIYWSKGDGVTIVLIRDQRMQHGYYILTAYPTFSKSPIGVNKQTQ